MGEPGYMKGPWQVVPYGDGNSLVICTADGKWRICFLATPGDSSGAWEAIKANARLIAAAPDLFEALTLAEAILSNTPEFSTTNSGRIPVTKVSEAREVARAALLKASHGGTKDAG